MQVEKGCCHVFLCQGTAFQDCNGVKDSFWQPWSLLDIGGCSGHLGQMWCPQTLTRTPVLFSHQHDSQAMGIPRWGHCLLKEYESSCCEVQEFYFTGSLVASPVLIPLPNHPVLRDGWLEACLCVFPPNREASTCRNPASKHLGSFPHSANCSVVLGCRALCLLTTSSRWL